MNRIVYDVSRWDVYLHRHERKLPFVREDDSQDLKFEDEVFERLYSGEMVDLEDGDKDHASAPWALAGHKMCDGLGLDIVAPYCKDAQFNAALATAWLMELIEEPLSGAKKAGKDQSGGRGNDEDELAAEGLENVDPSGGGGGGGGETVAEVIRKYPHLKLIALLAGRLRSTVITKQKTRTTNGAQEITNITVGGELERLLPSELVRFTSKKRWLKLAAMRDFIERKMIQYEMIATETLQEGPIVVLIDKSTSMEGPRDVWASAVALAMLDIAQRQKRAFALVSFNHAILKYTCVNAGEKIDVDSLLVEPDGGTDIGMALNVALELIQKKSTIKNGDVILISDGESPGDPGPIKKRAEGMGVTLYGVGIETEGVRAWCHRSHVISDVSSVDEGTMELLFTI